MSLKKNLFVTLLWCCLEIWSISHLEACQVKLNYIKANYYNPKYLKVNAFKTFRTKTDRESVRVNSSLTVAKDIDIGTTVVHLDVFRFQAQQFRKFPFNVNFDLCWGLQTNYFGIGRMIFENSNFTKCPIQKGDYYFHDVLIKPEDIPSCPPNGQYMGHLILLTEGEVGLNYTAVLEYF